MLYYLYMYMFMMIIMTIIYLTNLFISMIKFKNFEKNLPYECGFSPLTNPSLPFSLPFYLIALMFLIFDIEIVMLLPIIYILKSYNFFLFFFSISIFIIFLIITLYIELFFNMFNWIY